MHQIFQFLAQTGSAILGQLQKAEGLQASLRGPHGKHHLCAATNAGLSQMEQDCHADRFVEWMFERHQTAIHRKLAHAPADLAPVFEQHEDEDRASELDARIPMFLRRRAYRGHSASILHQRAATRQITKVRPLVSCPLLPAFVLWCEGLLAWRGFAPACENAWPLKLND